MAALQGEIKKSRASLVGGIAVGIGVVVLWTALARDMGFTDVATTVAGVAVALLVALWIWKADL